MSYLLTIITVSFNDLLGLKRTLNSLKPIIHSNLIEWIIIDNLSKDGTLEYVSEFTSSLNNVRFISDRDSGIYDGMNKGIHLANGKFLWFLNSGDISFIKSINELNFVEFSDINVFNIALLNSNLQSLRWKGLSIDINNLRNYPSVPHQSSIISKDVFYELGSFDLDYKIVSDYDFFCKAFVNKICFKFFPDYKLSGFINDGISSNFKNSYIIFLELKKIQLKYFGKVSFKTWIFYVSKYAMSFFFPSYFIQNFRKYIYK